MSRKAKGPGFTQRSGKSPAFKMMGSSPVARRFDSEEDLMAYRNSPQYNIDRLGEERIWDGKKQWRTDLGDWRGMTTVNKGGETSYLIPEWAKLDSPIDPKYGNVTRGSMLQPKKRLSAGFHRKAAEDAERYFQQKKEEEEYNRTIDETLAKSGARDFWSQY